jgi:hypothetical protein
MSLPRGDWVIYALQTEHSVPIRLGALCLGEGEPLHLTPMI